MLKLLEPFSESLVDDDAALINKTPLAEKEAGGDFIAETKNLLLLSPMR